MIPPNSAKYKRIALVILGVLLLSTGVIVVKKRGGSGAPDSGTATTAQTGSETSPAANGQTPQDNAATGGATGAGSGTSVATSADPSTATLEKTSPEQAAAPAAEKSGGIFASFFGKKKAATAEGTPSNPSHDASAKGAAAGDEKNSNGSATGAAVGAVGTVGGVAAGLGSTGPGATGAAAVPGAASAVGGAVTGAIGANGASAKTDATGGTAPATPTAPAVPEITCVNIAYHHKAIASHPDEESCSHHKNWLKLKHKDANPKSVCVRVNGTPVHYLSVKGHADELIFGSVAGPKAKVTVSYCTGKTTGCAQGAPLAGDPCVVPKDEFMEAIGGSEGAKSDPRLGQWDPTSKSEREADVMAKLDGAVKRELESNDELNGRAPAGDMFKDWVSDTETSSCGTRQASN